MLGDRQAVFERLATSLRLVRGSDEYGFAYAFWGELMPKAVAAGGDALAWASVEEAMVWRLLLWRMLGELGVRPSFASRETGVAKGSHTVHPGLDALAKTYERLRRSMKEITEGTGDKPAERPLGLPDRMKPLLEEAEVVFDELLGPGGFPGRAPKNGLDRRPNPGQ